MNARISSGITGARRSITCDSAGMSTLLIWTRSGPASASAEPSALNRGQGRRGHGADIADPRQ